MLIGKYFGSRGVASKAETVSLKNEMARQDEASATSEMEGRGQL